MANPLPRNYEYAQFQDPGFFYNWNVYTDEDIAGGSKARLFFDPLERCGN